MNGLWKALQDIVMFPFLIVAVLTFVVAGIRHSEFTKRHPYILPFLHRGGEGVIGPQLPH